MRIVDKKISELKVAIIGGGIGGAAAAVALRNEGIHAEVYEQAPVLAEVGAGIGLRSPTVQYFKDWGIYEQVAKKSCQSDYMEILAGNGEVKIKENWPALTDNPKERWARLIHRADLLDTFLSQIPSDSIHLNHRCKSISHHENYVEVHFENGHSIEADLVIGADGIRSLIRSKLISEDKPVYSGFHAYRTIVNKENAFNMASDANILQIYVDGQVQVYLMPLQDRKQVSVDVTAPSSDESWRPKVAKEEILNHLKCFDPKIQRIVENLNIEDFTCRPLYDIKPLERWSFGCVTLLGDAAHAMLHNVGQGANQAIQDGGALAVALRESNTVTEALQKYETRRKPITTKYQQLSRIFPSEEAETAFPEKEHFEKILN
ncbi:FAD-dependent monooxygenase [Virgibacillus sediminis]|uniref:FAD-dependent monooxygenase n=1 Tax=Virgibacillus sediminis TaxID=202260 RepID=A0ABV7A5G8_9BACI